MPTDLVCVGLTILDLLGRPVDALPDGVEVIEEIRMTPAGTAAGPAIVAAKLGLRVRLAGAIGDDEIGTALLRGLELRGVDCALVQTIEGTRSSATILPIRSNADRPGLHAPGAGLLVTAPDLDDFDGARFLHLGGVGLLPKLDGAPAQALLSAAKKRGVTVSCDVISVGAHTLAALEPILPHLDYFMPTLEEACLISGAEDAAGAAGFFADQGVGACVFKDGARGSLLARDGGLERVSAFEVAAVDTTGCGDAYCAGFVAALAHGCPPLEACRAGSATAALNATALGTGEAVPAWAAVVEAMGSLPVRPGGA